MSLADARDRRDTARQQLAAGKEPSEERQREKAELRSTLRDVAEEWFARQTKLSEATTDKARWIFDTHIYPALGSKPVKTITALTILRALRDIEDKGLHDGTQSALARAVVNSSKCVASAVARADRTPGTAVPFICTCEQAARAAD